MLHIDLLDGIDVEIGDRELRVTNSNHKAQDMRAKHGLIRSLLANAVKGVSEGFVKKLELHGVGYRVEVRGNGLELFVGYSHPIIMPFPSGVSADVEKKTNIISIKGFDKQVVGQYAADVRAKKPPEPYKGKGFRYEGEFVRRKSGKTV
jgi:large subunit ribosomal protein L6